MTASTMQELIAQEQHAATALRKAQEAKAALIAQQEQEAAQAAEAARSAYVARTKRANEIAVFGITHSKLQQITVPNLGAVRVHKDVFRLLRAAIVSRNDSEFFQLICALSIKLLEGVKELRPLAEQLKADSDTAHYFIESQDSVGLVIASGDGGVLLADLITLYALEYGRLVNFEEQE